jgi:putative two-component system hydrogenase maturation factor HypX/HoxX
MRILLLCHSFNSLTQRLHVELRERGHFVSVEFDINDAVTRDAVALFSPDLVVASFLKRAIPEDVWRRVLCLIVHPGVRGDRGPSALDWAILDGAPRWGVTLIEATAELDAGPVWAWREFPMRTAAKSSLYRHEVTQAALACVLEAIARIEAGATAAPAAQTNTAPSPLRPLCSLTHRTLDLARDKSEHVQRVVRSADGDPGAVATLFGRTVRVFDAHPAPGLAGEPGEALAQCGPAIAFATADGAVWIGHVKQDGPRQLKLPATHVFAAQVVALPHRAGYPAVAYAEEDGAGFLAFPFYNGAMGTQACRDLLAAYREALTRPTRVLVLMGGEDFWSNGMHLGLIEAANSPAEESWANIDAIDDLAQAIIETRDRLTVSALRGNAGAGGFFLALAADEMWMGEHVVANPHYKDMGNLYGSEYWTYLLPRRVGPAVAQRLTEIRWPIGIAEAERLGLAQRRLPAGRDAVWAEVKRLASELANAPDFAERLAAKQARRQADELAQPLQSYRDAELDRMRRNFFGFDPSYHVARYNFIRKIGKSHTPLTLALHRSRRRRAASGQPE